MKLYFSYKQLPELAKFTQSEKRIIWINFLLHREVTEAKKQRPDKLGFLIIGGFLVGLVTGAILTNGDDNGTILSGMIGMATPMASWHFIHLYLARKPLKQYIESPVFSLIPNSVRARMLILPFTWNRPDKN